MDTIFNYDIDAIVDAITSSVGFGVEYSGSLDDGTRFKWEPSKNSLMIQPNIPLEYIDIQIPLNKIDTFICQ